MSADGPPVENFPELDADVGPDIVQEDPKIGQINEIGNMGTGGAEKKWPGWPGESVFRILVPSPKVGGIIGRKGEYIKKTCEESRARIKILDGPQGAPERAVIISAKEEPDNVLPPAIDGLLRIHMRAIDGLEGEQSQGPGNDGNAVKTRLLVAASQAGSLIGKQGSTIKSIQEASNSAVRIVEELPILALHDDRVVEIQGQPSGVHKAVELIARQLRKFLVDRSVLPLFEMNMSTANARMERNMPPPQVPQPWGHPQAPPPNAPGGYGVNPQFMPPRPHDTFYPPPPGPPELPPVEKPPHHGVSTYGREPPTMGAHSANQQPQAVISQVTQHMQIPLSYADAVIGSGGASISYIRRASGATITIQESRGVPGEMTVEINGSATQVQTAQQLIQNFMAEAAAPPQNAALPPPMDQGYNSYPNHVNNMYMSAPPQNTGPGAPPTGGYGAGYGNNYGY